jgi:hypothetical protein
MKLYGDENKLSQAWMYANASSHVSLCLKKAEIYV